MAEESSQASIASCTQVSWRGSGAASSCVLTGCQRLSSGPAYETEGGSIAGVQTLTCDLPLPSAACRGSDPTNVATGAEISFAACVAWGFERSHIRARVLDKKATAGEVLFEAATVLPMRPAHVIDRRGVAGAVTFTADSDTDVVEYTFSFPASACPIATGLTLYSGSVVTVELSADVGLLEHIFVSAATSIRGYLNGQELTKQSSEYGEIMFTVPATEELCRSSAARSFVLRLPAALPPSNVAVVYGTTTATYLTVYATVPLIAPQLRYTVSSVHKGESRYGSTDMFVP